MVLCQNLSEGVFFFFFFVSLLFYSVIHLLSLSDFTQLVLS